LKAGLIIFVSVFLSVMIYFIPHQVYGDGFTQEILPPASVGDRKISLFEKINPPVITSQNNQDRYISFRWFDANTNQTVQHTTFLFGIAKNNHLLATAVFHTHTGVLTVKITPSNDPKKWAVHGLAVPFLDEYMFMPQGNNQTVDLVGPILGEGGLYHIFVTLITIDSDQNLFRPQDAPSFDSYLSVGDISNATISYENSLYSTTLISYYDRTYNYTFDPTKVQFSWSMPFDWNMTRIARQPIFIHEELHLPKSFKEFSDTPTYLASVNGNPISGRRIIVDPYSSNDSVIAHILLNKMDIENFTKTISLGTNTMNFELAPAAPNVQTSSSILTDFGGWGVKLGWNPSQLAANTQNSLQLSFFDAFTEQPVNGDVNYDLKILGNDGSIIFSKNDLAARNAIDTQMLNLPGNGVYVIEINIKSVVSPIGLVDTSRTGLARGNIVVPSSVSEEALPEFGDLTEVIISTSLVGAMMISRKFISNLS